ncbi:iron chaperone [Geothrix sp. PMB-07]|uniref:iron chaperone n=1 Tax=Geothrix sp. PMB-07 TaxID=3068640 RepID=UPI00274090C1|nr:DUF1801 domain-containing protein [Geothrix sp. PMB-07]WLT32338.1 DUF1801 domain-containing protein [Geothrix sp. PMB-07]
MAGRPKFVDVDDYLASVDPESQLILQEIRRIAKQAVPKAIECISYQMPALKLQKTFFYFASFKHHIGIYPPVKGDKRLNEELLPFRGPKGNLQFPKNKPIPYPLIKRVVEALAREYSE